MYKRQGAALREINIAQIRRNPFQPRTRFDQEKLQELADSIREHGVVQPVIVSPGKDGYILVAGERRFRAAQLAGLQTIPALTKELDSGMMLQIALIENLQREDLNPVEEARAYPVSYTHLDVYKRQPLTGGRLSSTL